MCLRNVMDVPKVDMDFALVERIASGLRGVNEVLMRGWGEPLIHPRFVDAVALLRKSAPNLNIRVTTAGHYLTGDVAEAMHRHKVSVDLSMERVDKGYAGGHPGSGLVRRNLEAFVKARDPKASAVVIQPTLQTGGLDDLLGVVDFAASAGVDRVNLIRMDSWLAPRSQRPTQEEEAAMVRRAREVAAGRIRVDFLNEPAFLVQTANHRDRLCIRTVFHAHVDVLGNVSPCVMLRDDRKIGNLKEQSLAEIWRSDAWNEWFANHEGDSICSKCDAFRHRQRVHDDPPAPPISANA